MRVRNASRRSAFQVTQAEINAGEVINEVTVTAATVNDEPVDDTQEAVVALPQDPKLQIRELQATLMPYSNHA